MVTRYHAARRFRGDSLRLDQPGVASATTTDKIGVLRPRRSRNTGLARVGLLLTLVGLVAIALLTDCTTEKPKGFGLQSERCEFVGWRLPPDSSQIIDFSVDDSSREAVASNRVYLPATQHTLDSIIPKEAIRWCAGPQGHSIRSDW